MSYIGKDFEFKKVITFLQCLNQTYPSLRNLIVSPKRFPVHLFGCDHGNYMATSKGEDIKFFKQMEDAVPSIVWSLLKLITEAVRFSDFKAKRRSMPKYHSILIPLFRDPACAFQVEWVMTLCGLNAARFNFHLSLPLENRVPRLRLVNGPD